MAGDIGGLARCMNQSCKWQCLSKNQKRLVKNITKHLKAECDGPIASLEEGTFNNTARVSEFLHLYTVDREPIVKQSSRYTPVRIET